MENLKQRVALGRRGPPKSLNKLHISMGPDWLHPQVLTEVDDVIVRPLLLIFERL